MPWKMQRSLWKLNKTVCLSIMILVMLVGLTGCKYIDGRSFAGNSSFDRLATNEAQNIYEELFNEIEAKHYEVTIDASDPQNLLDACCALVDDRPGDILTPVEMKILSEKELLSGKVRYTLRLIYSEK